MATRQGAVKEGDSGRVKPGISVGRGIKVVLRRIVRVISSRRPGC
jgi:hypothetical protein